MLSAIFVLLDSKGRRLKRHNADSVICIKLLGDRKYSFKLTLVIL